MTRRLLLTYLTLTLLVVVILEVPLGISIARREREQLTTEVERDAFVLGSFTEDALDQGGVLDAAPLRAYAEDTRARVVLVGTDGVALVDTDAAPGDPQRSFASRPEIATALGGEVATGTRWSETLGERLLYVAVPVASGGRVHGAVRITYPTSEVDAIVRRSWWTLAGVGAVSLVAASAIGVLLARSVTRPLRRLEHAAVAFGTGDLTARASGADGPSEVRTLAVAFDDMAARLEELVRAQEAFIADASHQLRNPLAALRLRIENLAADVGDDEVEPLLEEVARLSRIVDGLLALARADREAAATGAGRIDAAAILEERADHWRPLAEEREVHLEVDVQDPPLALVATRDRVRQVLDNLLANALEVAPPGSRVSLRAAPAGGRVDLHVVDEGPGMTPDERERAFDRFWRSGGAGPARFGGTGLGLAIVRKLVVADGGDVALGAAPGGGVDARVSYRRTATGVA